VKRTTGLLLALALVWSVSATAQGFIDPTFTPVDLVEQSEAILLLEFADPNEEGTGVGRVREVLKGKYDRESVTVDFMAMGEALAAPSREVMRWIAGGQRQAMLFIGSFMRDGGGGERLGYLHLAGQWVVLSEWQGDWDMERLAPRLLGCWAGSTDMLLRCVRYVMTDENATVPVSADAAWQPEALFAQLDGPIHAVEPVNVAGTAGTADLFVACADGDRLYRFDGAAMADVTSQHGLTSKSRLFAWAELTGDGRLDLLSWDGRTLSLHARGADGTFEARPLAGGEELLGDGCLSLATVGAEGGTKVVAGVAGPPLLLTVRTDGSLDAEPVTDAAWPAEGLGSPGECLVADLDGDGRPDVLQLFAGGSLFYRGTGAAEFAAPVASQVAVGEGRHDACTGDYDADGLLDVFVAGERHRRLFHNLGGGRFVDQLHQSGEVEYISKPGGIGVQTGDVNNDGRQDLLVVYGAQMAPQLFFNRGFRSFGHARDLDLDVQDLLPAAADGQHGGCLGDFNGDGAPDMVLALVNGELWLFLREVEHGTAMAVTATVSPRSPYAGPLNVAAWAGDPPRALGTQVVRQGGAPVLWGVPESEAGDVTVRWRTPDGAEETRIVEVVPGDEPQHVLLGDPDDD